MKIITQTLNTFFGKDIFEDNYHYSNYILYIIVDAHGDSEFVLRCKNKHCTFISNIFDMVSDPNIISGLHPIQACFIGIEFVKFLSNNPSKIKQKKVVNDYPDSRYGIYQFCSIEYKGKVRFINRQNNKEYIMDPFDIAISKKLISEFDATQAFHIGILAGNEIDDTSTKSSKPKTRLRLIK